MSKASTYDRYKDRKDTIDKLLKQAKDNGYDVNLNGVERYVDVGGDDGLIAEAISKKYNISDYTVAEYEPPEDDSRYIDSSDGTLDAYTDDDIQLITCYMSLHHMGDKLITMLDSISNKSSDGTILIVREHNIDGHSKDVMDDIEYLDWKHLGYYIRELDTYEDLRIRLNTSYTNEATLTRLLTNRGFERIAIVDQKGRQKIYTSMYIYTGNSGGDIDSVEYINTSNYQMPVFSIRYNPSKRRRLLGLLSVNIKDNKLIKKLDSALLSSTTYSELFNKLRNVIV